MSINDFDGSVTDDLLVSEDLPVPHVDMLDFDDDDLSITVPSEGPAESETWVNDSYSDESGNSSDDENDPVPRLEEMVANCLESLLHTLPASLPNKGRAHASMKIKLANRTPTSRDRSTATTKIVAFPQNTKKDSSSTFAQVLRIVDLMHEALYDEMPITKRDIYYRDVALFKKQSTVDKHVDDIAATIGTSRGDLNVRASSKGLFCGSGLAIHLHSGEILHGNDTESTLIPAADEIERFDIIDGLVWVLVVEKEAVFQTLARLRFSAHPTGAGWGIVITGKGYPDVATRQFVCTLANNLPESVPILAIVDGDAFGLDIVSVYKYGSHSMAHERETLAAPRLEWIGVMNSELSQFGVEKDSLLPITKYDEKKARTLLRRPDLPHAWRRELQYMLFNRRKAEIEILANSRYPKDISILVPGSQTSNLSPQLINGSGIPLIKYLVHKLGVAMVQCNLDELEDS